MNEDAHSSTGLGLTPRDQTLAESAVDFASDPLIAALKKDVDRTLLIDNLRLTFDQRARRMNEFMRALETLRAGRPSRRT